MKMPAKCRITFLLFYCNGCMAVLRVTKALQNGGMLLKSLRTVFLIFLQQSLEQRHILAHIALAIVQIA